MHVYKTDNSRWTVLSCLILSHFLKCLSLLQRARHLQRNTALYSACRVSWNVTLPLSLFFLQPLHQNFLSPVLRAHCECWPVVLSVSRSNYSTDLQRRYAKGSGLFHRFDRSSRFFCISFRVENGARIASADIVTNRAKTQTRPFASTLRLPSTIRHDMLTNYIMQRMFSVRPVVFVCAYRTEKGVPVSGVRQSVVLKSEPEEARGGQARVPTRGVPVCHMRTGVLFAKLADDAHLHVPQDEAHDAVAAAAAPRAPAAHHALRHQVLVSDTKRWVWLDRGRRMRCLKTKREFYFCPLGILRPQ